MRWSFITDGNYIKFVHTDETDLHIQQTIHRLHNTSRCIDWSLPADTTRITFTIDESKYENISIYDVDFDGVVMSVQSDFETNITAMFTGLAGGGSSSYLVYTATADAPDSGGGIPNITIMQNTIGAIVWTVFSTGYYKGTLAGAFPAGKVWAFPGGNAQQVTLGIGSSLPFDNAYNVQRISDDQIAISIYRTSDYAGVDLFDIGTSGTGNGLPFRIEVYP